MMARANRTGGPRTAAGKLAASKNALKTGAYSAVALLPNENIEEFNRLIAQFVADLKPTDVVENSLVHDLAEMTWRKLRLQQLKQSYLLKKLNEPVTVAEFETCHIEMTIDRYRVWQLGQPLSDQALVKHRAIIADWRDYAVKSMTVSTLKTLLSKHPEIKALLFDLYHQHQPFEQSEPTLKRLVEFVAHASGDSMPRPYLKIFAEGLMKVYEAEVWVTEHGSEIEEAIQLIKQERLWHLMESEGASRAENDLRRAFSNTLSALRKHQQWKRQSIILDVNEH